MAADHLNNIAFPEWLSNQKQKGFSINNEIPDYSYTDKNGQNWVRYRPSIDMLNNDEPFFSVEEFH